MKVMLVPHVSEGSTVICTEPVICTGAVANSWWLVLFTGIGADQTNTDCKVSLSILSADLAYHLFPPPSPPPPPSVLSPQGNHGWQGGDGEPHDYLPSGGGEREASDWDTGGEERWKTISRTYECILAEYPGSTPSPRPYALALALALAPSP